MKNKDEVDCGQERFIMPKFIVEYEHEVVITYETEVEAETKEEAIQKIHDGDFEEEHENDYQGMYIRVKDVYKSEK